MFRLELCSAHSEIQSAFIISTIVSSIISFFGLLILALCRLLILAQAPLPAQPLQALMHFLRWAWAFCILELSLLLYQLTDLGLVQALVFLETALFRLGWCALCRLSPPWFRRFWRDLACAGFCFLPCTALVQAQGLFFPSPAFPSPWLAVCPLILTKGCLYAGCAGVSFSS